MLKYHASEGEYHVPSMSAEQVKKVSRRMCRQFFVSSKFCHQFLHLSKKIILIRQLVLSYCHKVEILLSVFIQAPSQRSRLFNLPPVISIFAELEYG